MNFPQTHYAMSSDPAPFVPPERYPTPPKNMWYEVPKEPPAHPKEKPKPLFPWETHQPRPTRVFAHQEPEPEHAQASHDEDHTSSGSHTLVGPTTSESHAGGNQSPPGTASSTAVSAPSDIWSSFPRTNAWDTVPEINRYVDKLEKHRRSRSRNLVLGGGKPRSGGAGGGGGSAAESSSWDTSRRGSKVTDFPSEDDRPSLPVTPAPIRRPRRWGSGGPGDDVRGEDAEQLPDAEGVPAQAEWVCVHGIRWSPADCLCDLTNVLRFHKDPAAQLEKLAKAQSELLFQRLGGGDDGGRNGQGAQPHREIPSRPLPFGSEDARSPTYVAPAPPVVVSPRPVKPHTGTSPVNRILAASQEAAKRTTAAAQHRGYGIPAPSYQGPGASFEKGEDYPTYETPALPTEEDRDVLDT
jgi:hypothetical protein